MSQIRAPIEGSSIIFTGNFEVQAVSFGWLDELLSRGSGGPVEPIALLPDEFIHVRSKYVEVVAEKNRIQVQSMLQAPLPGKVLDVAAEIIEDQRSVSNFGVNFWLHYPVDGSLNFFNRIQKHFIRDNIFDLDSRPARITKLHLQFPEDPSGFSYHSNATVFIEPSMAISQGIFCNVNVHQGFQTSNEPVPTPGPGLEVTKVLPDRWSIAERYATVAFDKVRALARGA